MKDEKEINVAVAKALGWQVQCDGPPDFEMLGLHPRKHQADDAPVELPAFFRDANTRPEMLASLTEEEKVTLIDTLLEFPIFPIYPQDIGENEVIKLLELDQPTFAALFLKVKGLA